MAFSWRGLQQTGHRPAGLIGPVATLTGEPVAQTSCSSGWGVQAVP